MVVAVIKIFDDCFLKAAQYLIPLPKSYWEQKSSVRPSRAFVLFASAESTVRDAEMSQRSNKNPKPRLAHLS